MQRVRIDRSVDAVRSLHQGLSLSVFDATGDRTQTVDLHLAFRFFTDIGIERELRDDAWIARDWNATLLDEAWVTWRPISPLRVRAGRQVGYDALGMRDFDGASILFRPRLGPQVHGHVEAWGGRDVQFESGRYDADAYDVQGLPVNSEFADGAVSWVFGGRAGLSWTRASVDVAYARRQYTLTQVETLEDEVDVLGDERVGAAMSGVVGRAVTLAVQGSYHTILGDVDRAGVQMSWRLPVPLETTVSSGLQYTVPIFDSASIFNLFGANPHQGAWIAWQLDLPVIDTSFETRGWGRILHGDFDAADLGESSDDATVWGAALSHHTRFRLLDTPFRWRTLGSLQTSIDGAYGGDQWLVDSQLRAPVALFRGVWAYVRGLVLIATTATTSPRETSGWATSGVVGLEWRTQLGVFSAALETSDSSNVGGNTQGWLSFEVEVWP